MSIEICREAWRGSKRGTQPDYDDLSETYREMLSIRAQPIIDGGIFPDDDALRSFDNLVFDLSHPRVVEPAPEPEVEAAPKPKQTAKKLAETKAVKKKAK